MCLLEIIKSLQESVWPPLEASLDHLQITPPSHFCPQKVEGLVVEFIIGYGGENENTMRKYSFANGLSREKLLPQGATFFWPGLMTCI